MVAVKTHNDEDDTDLPTEERRRAESEVQRPLLEQWQSGDATRRVLQHPGPGKQRRRKAPGTTAASAEVPDNLSSTLTDWLFANDLPGATTIVEVTDSSGNVTVPDPIWRALVRFVGSTRPVPCGPVIYNALVREPANLTELTEEGQNIPNQQ